MPITGPFTGGSAPMGVSMRDGVKVGDKMMKIEAIERDDEAYLG